MSVSMLAFKIPKSNIACMVVERQRDRNEVRVKRMITRKWIFS